MYLTHFALREPPFGLTPDTAFAFACTPHQEALNTLLIASANGEGFMKVTGEVGTGKTLLCRRFLSQLDDATVSAYIPNPLLDPHGLLLALAAELRLDVGRDDDQPSLVKALNEALLVHARADKRVVVCLDEAQAMPLETLESLRLLSNLETEKRKLFQVVLFGQPELDEKLADE
jgi:MSHA biogenesis protein MshM